MSEEGAKENLTRRTVKLDCFKKSRLLLLHVSEPKNKGMYKIFKFIHLNSKLQITY